MYRCVPANAVNAVPVKDGALATSEENAKEEDVAIAKISNVDARRKAAIMVSVNSEGF
jgi:hypothetical protein